VQPSHLFQAVGAVVSHLIGETVVPKVRQGRKCLVAPPGRFDLGLTSKHALLNQISNTYTQADSIPRRKNHAVAVD
jgi:hypothetical protein